MAEISITHLTNKEPDGGGVFDDLMESVKAHVHEEFKKKRINQADYAKVYLGALEAVLGQSVQFLLQKQQADKQAELISAQIDKTEQDTKVAEAQENNIMQSTLKIAKDAELVDQQILLSKEEIELMQANIQKVHQEISNLAIQGKVLIGESEKIEQEVLVAQQQVLNMEQQVLKTAAEVSMLGKQEEKIDADIVISLQQLQSMASEIELTNARRDLTLAQAANAALEVGKINAEIALMDARAANTVKEGALLDQQLLVSQYEVMKIAAEIDLLEARVAAEELQTDLITAQVSKIEAEVILLGHKSNVELAQYADKIDGADVEGILGKQKGLFEAQIDGFAKDAQQKLAKMMIDSFNVRKSADPAGTAADKKNLLDNESIGDVIKKAREGIGIVTPPPP